MKAIRITNEFAQMHKVEALAKEAFPPKEYQSPQTIIQMQNRGEVDFWGLYDNQTFVGFMVVKIFENLCYLFFLAIANEFRSKGYGAKAIGSLEELYPKKQQVVDFEKIDDKAENFEQRIVRKKFYIKNGFKETGKFLSYLGIDYEILCKDNSFDFDQFKRMMNDVHIKGFKPVYFEK